MRTQAPGKLLSIEALAGIMMLQQMRDPFTNDLFPLPDSLGNYSGWGDWRQHLPAEQRKFTPQLTYVTKAGGFTLGNVLFLSKIVSDAALAHGGLATFRQLCREPLGAIFVPQPDVVHEAGGKWLYNLRILWKPHRTI